MTIQRVVLNLDSFARFTAKVPRGKASLIRVVLPGKETGPGYLTGVGKAIRVHR